MSFKRYSVVYIHCFQLRLNFCLVLGFSYILYCCLMARQHYCSLEITIKIGS
uniref:Uncharacterized protein n=1 Tax=Rhizophora mucronata TaxID=61149 RepID=A0A2P2QPW9_RHIMU